METIATNFHFGEYVFRLHLPLSADAGAPTLPIYFISTVRTGRTIRDGYWPTAWEIKMSIYIQNREVAEFLDIDEFQESGMLLRVLDFVHDFNSPRKPTVYRDSMECLARLMNNGHFGGCQGWNAHAVLCGLLTPWEVDPPRKDDDIMARELRWVSFP